MIIAHIRSSFVEAFFPRWAEWAASLVLLALGWMLSANEDLMLKAVASGSGRGYTLLLAIAGQGTWAFALSLFATARLIVLLVNGAWKRSPVARACFASLSCLFWSLIALSFQPTFGFAMIMAYGWLLTDFVNVMRAARDARTVNDGLARGKDIGLE